MQLTQSFTIVILYFAAQSTPAKYDYKLALNYSLLFYEAQRSGKLPADQHVTWRHDSALNDKGDNGEDLTGGYYDAGDHVKFGFPMAYTITMLSWGALHYEEGYKSAGLTSAVQEAIKWGTDYFLKCHVEENTFYGQVGNGDIDHEVWGRPEDMTMERPAYKITAENPGSELAGETAAALAAASIVFRTADPDYSNTLLEHAKQLFSFANNHRGFYNESIPDAAKFYNSFNGYNDEIVWAASWLAKAIFDIPSLDAATSLYTELQLNNVKSYNFGWNDKTAGIEALLAELTQDESHLSNLKSYADDILNNRDYTPKGLVYIADWGSLRRAADATFIVLRAKELGVGGDEYLDFAKKQLGYMLGDTGRSFVVGFGDNPPTHAHHRASSCPDPPATCDRTNYYSLDPNPHILYGALVGGPDRNDVYADNRTDYEHNEVACDYNAAFSGILANFIQNGY